MRALLRFRTNRPVDFDKDFVSPGGFTVTLGSGETRQFDFLEVSAGVEPTDPCVYEADLRDIDTTYADGDALSISDIKDVRRVDEIFVGISDEKWGSQPHDDLVIEEMVSFDFEGYDPVQQELVAVSLPMEACPVSCIYADYCI